MPRDHPGRTVKLWNYSIYAALAVIAVLLWFAYNSDRSVAAGGDPAGNGMSRAFGQLISIATGLVSLIVAMIALRVNVPEVKAVLLILLIPLAILMAFLI